MTTLAGTCRFTEANNATRVFALCDFSDRTVLVPVSVPGDIDVRGIKSAADSHRLELRMGHLPANLRRIFVGLTTPLHHHLGEADFALRLTNDSGHTTDIPLARALGNQNRYALMTILLRTGATWDGRRLRQPQVFPDRATLAETHSVPSWWTRRA